jgi:ferritin
MANLLSIDLNNVLCEQIAQERYNAGAYMKIAGILEQKGLNKLAKHFIGQVEEENGHAKQIYDYIVDLNGFINVQTVSPVVSDLSDILEIANLYMNTEIETTNSLKEIANLAMDENDLVTWDFMMEMLKQQRTEYAEATTFLDNAELCGSDWYKVKVWNDSISE